MARKPRPMIRLAVLLAMCGAGWAVVFAFVYWAAGQVQ